MTTSRKLCRSGQPCTPETMKEALDCLAHHGALPVKGLAERIGHVSEGTLGKQLSKYDEDNYPPLRQVVPLTVAAENDALITYLARACGGVFVRLHASAGHDVDAEHIGKALREFADVLQCHASASADGVVTADEANTLDREVDEACAELAALKMRFRARVQPSPMGLARRSA
jgi:hypothetical protein